jgi:LysM repeat protein
MKPIYAGAYQRRGSGKGKVIFILIVLIQLAAVGAYLYFKSDKSEQPEELVAPAPSGLSTMPVSSTPEQPIYTPQSTAMVSDAQAALDAGQLVEAQKLLTKIVSTTPDPNGIKLLSDVNIQLIQSSLMMPGKEYYVIKSGDYLQKIAKNHNTTVSLLKMMNGMESDTIRLGDRMLVFNGNFSLRVSKSRNELDLLNNGKLFKRYSVGTGKFGKTPAVEFTIVDKIIEPPWTRPSDNKQIEYGDPENVLGSRWMAIKSSDHPELTGFGIHGTWERDSIGQQSSAGCIRMLNEDVEELFNLVPRKTSVTITE